MVHCGDGGFPPGSVCYRELPWGYLSIDFATHISTLKKAKKRGEISVSIVLCQKAKLFTVKYFTHLKI